jgi:hypothetical protein
LKYVNLLSALVFAGFVAAFSAGYVGYANGSLPTIDTASAACAARAATLEVEPKRAVPGDSFEVRGENFSEIVECDDTGTPGDEDIGGVQAEPVEDIPVELKQGSREWELTTVDADQDFSFDTELKLPAGVSPGQATVTAEGVYGPASVPISIVANDKADTSSGSGEDVTSLPDTGGPPFSGIAVAIGVLLVGGGVLLKRRLA